MPANKMPEAQFETYRKSPKIEGLFSDLMEADNDSERKVAIHLANSFYKFNFENAIFSGYVETGRMLSVAIHGNDGNIWQDINIKTGMAGHLSVRSKTGDYRDIIGRDVITPFTEQWLDLNGYPIDYPCSVECTVDGSELDLKLIPLL